MPEDPGSSHAPTTAEAAQEALEIVRASVVEQRIADLGKRTDPGHPGDEAGTPEVEADTTDMNAVGDDGQVFGG